MSSVCAHHDTHTHKNAHPIRVQITTPAPAYPHTQNQSKNDGSNSVLCRFPHFRFISCVDSEMTRVLEEMPSSRFVVLIFMMKRLFSNAGSSLTSYRSNACAHHGVHTYDLVIYCCICLRKKSR